MFSKLAQAFKPHGLKVVIEPPKKFSWNDDVLPLAVDLTNRGEEPIGVSALTFQVREVQQNEESFGEREWERHSALSFTHDVNLSIAPGTTETVEVVIPVTMQAMTPEEAPTWMKFAGKAMDMAQRAKGTTGQYAVRVAVDVVGEKNQRTAVKEFGGGFSMRTSWGR